MEPFQIASIRGVDFIKVHDLRSRRFAAGDTVPKRQDEIGVRAHVTRPDDAVREEQFERLHAGCLVVRVHVPEAWNEELSAPIHTGRAGRGDRRSADAGNAIAVVRLR
jgi:hypothetical protein